MLFARQRLKSPRWFATGLWAEDHGYEASSAANGEQAMQAILRQRPDLVLMDLSMPHQSGIQLYRQLQRQDSLRTIPAIFVTGLAQCQIFDEASSRLPDPAACIQKPIDLEALGSAIQRVLG